MSWHRHCLGRSYWSGCLEGCLWRASRWTNFLSHLILLMEEIPRPTTWEVKRPVNNGIGHLATGAGFLPSTVWFVFSDFFPPGNSGNRRLWWPKPGDFPGTSLISTVRNADVLNMMVSLFIPNCVPWKSSDSISSDKIRIYYEVRVLEMFSRTTNKGLMYWFMKKLYSGFFLKSPDASILFAAKDRIQCGTGCSEDKHCTLGGFRWHCWILEATRINMLKVGNRCKYPPKTSISTHHGTGNSLYLQRVLKKHHKQYNIIKLAEGIVEHA